MGSKRRLVITLVALSLLAGPLVACLPEKKQIPVEPKVLGQYPRPGQDLGLKVPLVIDFNQPMDEASVKQAIRIDPPVPGQVSVKGSQVMFTPSDSGFKRGTDYRVTIGPAAKSTKGTPLTDEVVLRFSTIGYLTVAETQPADGTSDVDRRSAIVVVFNRPVVPLTALQSKSGLPQPLTLDPPVEGVGEWLNTGIFQFTPKEGLAGSTRYKATVKAGLQDTVGSVLEADCTWAFTTSLPSVVRFAPQGEKVAPSAVISATFNQPVDPGSVQAFFKLSDAKTGQPVAGALAVSGESVSFRPSRALTFGARYLAHLGKGLKSSTGGALAADVDWQFTVVPLPAVIGATPANGDRNASPYGGVEIRFAGPMLLETITPTLRVEPQPQDLSIYYSEQDSRLFLSFPVAPATEYRVVIPGAASDPYGNTLGRDYVLTFRTRDLDPMAFLESRGFQVSSFDAYTRTVAAVSYRNVTRLDLALYSVGLDDFLRLNGDDYEFTSKYAPKASQLLRRWSVPVSAPRNVAAILALSIEAVAGRSLEPGTYYLELTAPELGTSAKGPQMSKSTFLVSRTNLTLKTSTTQALVWATDLRTGQGLPDQSVTIYDHDRGVLQSGATDAEGLFVTDLPPQLEPYRPVFAVIGQGSAFAVTSSRWCGGIEPYQYSIFSDLFDQPFNGFVYTDRPIYRPAQKVYFKGIVRADNDAVYSLPQPLPVTVVIRDPQNREVYDQQLTLSDMGTFDGELLLDKEAALGYYFISAALDVPGQERVPTFSGSFQIAAYRKPEFEISVEAERAEYIHGDTIRVSVNARYFFGAPLASGKAEWTVTASPFYFQWTGSGYYDFADVDYAEGYPPPTQRVLAQGQGTTDAQGRLEFQVPADIAAYPQSQLFTVEVTITDVNNQQVAGRASAVVHKGAFYIGLRPDVYVIQAGEPVNINVLTVDPESVPVPQVSATLTFYQRKWYSAQERTDTGQYLWTSRYLDTPVFVQTVTTDAKGQASVAFTPPSGGAYKVLASARDGRGNEIRSSTFLWVSGSANEYVSWEQQNNNRITLVADKKSYLPGETAHVLVPSPFQGDVLALVTVERGRILSRQVVTLKGNSAQLDIPIASDFAPDVYLSVLIVKGQDATNPAGTFRLGYIGLDVSTVEKELTIKLTPDRKGNYAPRAKATFAVETLNHKGQGVPAELSLALVDLSVLTLAGSPDNPIRERFYGKRGLGVQTATNVTLQPEMATVAQERGGKGGGGSEGLAVRTEFPDTAYWNARLRTGADGRAQVTVDLPDSLTTWRLLAAGVTADTLVGDAKTDIVATKDLLIRTVNPRFFVIGDQADLSAIVHNNTDQPVRAAVSLKAEGLKVEGVNQTVDVPAHGLTKVTWKATALVADQAVVLFTADAGALKDAVQLTLPIHHYTTPEVVATSGQVAAGEQRMELATLPEVYDATQGDLSIRVEPSLASGAREGLAYLEHYPYECIEQTVSRFLPNVVTLRALRELGIADLELEARLPQLVGTGLQRIYSAQKLDGGWGWWPADESSPFVTAYVLFALGETKRADLSVDDSVVKRGTDYLKRFHNVANLKDTSEANRQAFIAFVFAQLGQGDNGRAVTLFDQHEKLGHYGKAFLALTLQKLGSEHASRIQTLVGELAGQAIASATATHWEESQVDALNMNTDVRTTAIVLRALVALKPDSPLIANVVRWLMAARVDGRWGSTQENAWALMALTDYMVLTGELQGNYKFQVGLNGKRVLADTVSPSDIQNPRMLSIPIKDLLKAAANSVLFERMPVEKGQGEAGTLYYTLDLRYFLPVDKVEPLDQGIIVSRQYVLADRPETPIHSANVNDTILVTVTLVAPSNLHFLVLEDPIPAGTEAVDTSLMTTSSLLPPPVLEPQGKEPAAPLPKIVRPAPWFGYQYFSHSELRDEKVVLFANYLPRGTYVYSYLVRASVPGQFLVMPTVAYQMYFPETFGRGAGERFTVGE